MAIRSSNKISPSFNMSSMTDMVFLLLIFFVCTSTMVNPNALKLLLPQSNNQTTAKALTSVSVTKELNYYIETTLVAFSDLERQLQLKIMEKNESDVTIAIHVDATVPTGELVKIMNIAQRNKWKTILATRPERR